MASTIVVPSELTSSATIELSYTIVNVIDRFPPYTGLDDSFLIADIQLLRRRLNTTISRSNTYDAYRYYDVNRLWLNLDGLKPEQGLMTTLEKIPGFRDAKYAWVRYSEIQRDPLANTLTGILFAAFWLSLLLSLLDFAFYMHVNIRRRSIDFAALRAIGWRERNLLNLLMIEQAAFIVPALVIGVLLGILLAYMVLPFLVFAGALGLQIPGRSIAGLVGILVSSFFFILRVVAVILRRTSLSDTMRFGE